MGIGICIGLWSCIIIMLLLYDVIKLKTCEKYTCITKFESMIYFFGFLIFYSYVSIFLEMNSLFLLQNWLFIVLIGLSYSNYLIFRVSYRKKLRINLRFL